MQNNKTNLKTCIIQSCEWCDCTELSIYLGRSGSVVQSPGGISLPVDMDADFTCPRFPPPDDGGPLPSLGDPGPCFTLRPSKPLQTQPAKPARK